MPTYTVFYNNVRGFIMSKILIERLDKIASYGFGVYSVPVGYAIANPSDDRDGFYLVVGTIDELTMEFFNWLETR